MNSDKPLTPGEELEIRITAMLMGELSPDESAALRERLAATPELQALHTRLARAYDLLRAAVPLGDTIEHLTPARLSNERRERLLRRFKATAVSNPVIVPIVKKRWTWLAPLSWAASFTIAMGILVWQMAQPAGRLSSAPDFESTAGGLTVRPPEGTPIQNRRLNASVDEFGFKADAIPAPASEVPRPAPATPALATAPTSAPNSLADNVDEPKMPYYRGRGIEETGKSYFQAGGTGGQGAPDASQPSAPVAKADPASPQSTWESQAGAIRLRTKSGSLSETTVAEVPKVMAGENFRSLAIADDESSKRNTNTATEGTFWDNKAENRPAAPALPASSPAPAAAGATAANGAAFDSERTLGVKARSLIEEKEKLVTELAESKAMTESLQRESSELKSTLGKLEDSMDKLKMAIPGTPALGSVPINGSSFGAAVPDAAARGEAPAGATNEVPQMLARRAGGAGGGERKQWQEAQSPRVGATKDGVPPAPAKPATATATGNVAGVPVDALSEAGDKQVGDINQARSGARGYAGRAIAGGIPMEPAQAEASVEKLTELAAVDELSRADSPNVAAKLKSTRQLDRTTADRRPITLFGRDEKAAEAVPDMDSDFSIVDGGVAAGQAEPGKKQKAKELLLEADGFVDTGRFDLADKRYGEILALDPYNVEAREGQEKIASKRADSTVSFVISQIREADSKAEEFGNVAAPGDHAWYFKQDGTLAKLSKGQSVDVSGPGQQPAQLAFKLAPENSVTLSKEVDAPVAAPQAVAPVPQPEIATSANAFSTFSLNVSDVAFKLAAASLEQNKMPDPAAIRSEEFINAFDYRDPEPVATAPLAFASERARYPFAQNRDLLRLSIKTAAVGRQPGRPLNLVLLVDNSGSMERADRVQILRESLRVLARQFQPTDKLSIITFARTPHLWIDGVAGNQAAEATQRVGEITPQGGTNLSSALDLAYETARKHYQVANINRVVLLTDGAANLGDVNPAALKQKVEEQRKQGIALDCFGVGWEGYNDDLLEQLSRNGDGRYGFINSPDAAATEFAGQLAGALRVAASDVKVQVEFNPKRVTAYRQIGYARHQLTKEQFRDNTVDAAEIGAAESGNALYAIEVNPRGEGDLATVRARFKLPGTSDYREHEWTVPFSPNVPALEQASPTMRLAATASAFSEWLAGSPYATEITSDRLLGIINGVPQTFGTDPRPQKLEWMIRQAKSLSGR